MMSTDIDESLTNGEQVRYSAKVSLWRYWFAFLIGAGICVGSLTGLAASVLPSRGDSGVPSFVGPKTDAIFLVLGLIILAWPLIARRSTQLLITDRRLIAKYGVISIDSIEIRFEKIESVRVSQGLLGRILGYGDIVVTGTGSTFDPIPNIANAQRFRMALNQAMELRVSTGTGPPR